jgi:hypothetical protein
VTRAGSLEAKLALVRVAVQAGDYAEAQRRLRDTELRYADVPAAHLVTVAPDVLGPLSLEGDGDGDYPGAGTFTVISPYVQRAAAAVERVAQRLMLVDEHGVLHSDDELDALDRGEAYTPNYVDDVRYGQYGAIVVLDTKSWMSSAMGRTMVGVLSAALVEDGVAAHITGYCRDLDSDWAVWTAPDAGA